MLIFKEVDKILNKELPKVKGIINKKTNKFYNKGENPHYDMEIVNYILCPEGVDDWYNFIKSNYELVYI